MWKAVGCRARGSGVPGEWPWPVRATRGPGAAGRGAVRRDSSHTTSYDFLMIFKALFRPAIGRGQERRRVVGSAEWLCRGAWAARSRTSTRRRCDLRDSHSALWVSQHAVHTDDRFSFGPASDAPAPGGSPAIPPPPSVLGGRTNKETADSVCARDSTNTRFRGRHGTRGTKDVKGGATAGECGSLDWSRSSELR